MATGKDGFYSLKEILEKRADINLIISGRSNGKTYSLCKYVLEQYKKHGKKFVYVRRWVDDIKIANAQKLFLPLKDEIEKLFGEGYEVTYYQKQYFLKDPEGNKEIIGHVLALSESHHQKSVSYTDIGTIFFDEFIQMSGERILPDELSRYENTLSTIIRFHTDIKVFLLANTVSKFAPYFSYYKIDINHMEPKDIIVNDFPTDAGVLRVACEYAEVSKKISKKTSKYILNSKMITNGQWEIPEIDDIITAPGERAKEKLLFSAWDPEAEVNIGVYLRTAIWYTIEVKNFISQNVQHTRQFLVVRNNPKKSSYYHLTNIKDLSYSTWTSWREMVKDIFDSTGIDVEHELKMNRVYCDSMFTADFFNHVYLYYNSLKIRDLL